MHEKDFLFILNVVISVYSCSLTLKRRSIAQNGCNSPWAQTWVLLVLLIPSILLSFFHLDSLLKDRALHTALNNHVIIYLFVALWSLRRILWCPRTKSVLSNTETMKIPAPSVLPAILSLFSGSCHVYSSNDTSSLAFHNTCIFHYYTQRCAAHTSYPLKISDLARNRLMKLQKIWHSRCCRYRFSVFYY